MLARARLLRQAGCRRRLSSLQTEAGSRDQRAHACAPWQPHRHHVYYRRGDRGRGDRGRGAVPVRAHCLYGAASQGSTVYGAVLGAS